MRRLIMVLAVSLLVVGCAARDQYGNPYPRPSENLVARFGCTPEEIEQERVNWHLAPKPGQSVCVALARYGTPASVYFIDNPILESVRMSWTIGRGSYPYLSSVSARKYKDVPITYESGNGHRVGKWIIDTVSGFEGY